MENHGISQPLENPILILDVVLLAWPKQATSRLYQRNST